MGQLEKYGLYVLCLVIFLILGVAIWGGDPSNVPQGAKDVTKLAAADGGKGKEPAKEQPKEPAKEQPKPAADAGKAPGRDASASNEELKGFFTPIRPEGKTAAGKDAKPEAKPEAKPDAKLEEAKPAAPRTYVVQDHDTLSRIAEKELGARGRVADIEALNPTIKAGLIRKGDLIKLPPARTAQVADAGKQEAKAEPKADPKAAAASGKPVPGKPYKVQNGDTLTSIAVAAYGNEKRVKDIFAANHGKLSSMHKLPSNITLMLP
jgi:nucleoid-associated protein YgaU